MNRTSTTPRRAYVPVFNCLECVEGIYLGGDCPTCHKCGHVMPAKMQQAIRQLPPIFAA